MKYRMASKMWKHPDQTTACYLLSAAPAGPKLVCVDVCAAWWDVVASLSLAGCVDLDRACRGRAPNLHTRPKSQSARKAIGLTAHVIETAKPRRPRALARVAVVESGGGLAG